MRRISAPAFAALLLALPGAALAQDANARMNALETQMGQARVQMAQLFGRPPADVPGGGDQYQQTQDDDGSNMTVRLGHLENEMRDLTGQIEQLQFQQRRLDDQMRKMQQDIDFRFQDLQNGKGSGAARVPGKRTELSDPEPGVQTGAVTPPQGQGPVVADDNPQPQPGVVTGVHRGDAFDPNALPNAPGAPRQLGTTQPSAPLRSNTPGGPVVASGPMDLSAPGVQPASGTVGQPISPGGGRSDYDMAVSQYKLGQLAEAENAFKDFIAKNPKDRMVPDATYYLAQAYFREGRHREAAEQFLKFTTDYPNAPRAPESLLHLGTSLDALGAKEQACATFQEVGRRYPNAAPSIRSGADREYKRVGC
ncbi:tol-pal system protein YbgF [Methylovirgula sp. 4M-Z18]|uniref:tol-pal system protein YbgF n=1 Tax=Methylovirgula sp. 4M-Z18 TaxID=2293567 RepID=UPI001AEC9703|nr:tol-pal system protein YbgF [Methylovirgula sp. 4M-Z18]